MFRAAFFVFVELRSVLGFELFLKRCDALFLLDRVQCQLFDLFQELHGKLGYTDAFFAHCLRRSDAGKMLVGSDERLDFAKWREIVVGCEDVIRTLHLLALDPDFAAAADNLNGRLSLGIVRTDVAVMGFQLNAADP